MRRMGNNSNVHRKDEQLLLLLPPILLLPHRTLISEAWQFPKV